MGVSQEKVIAIHCAAYVQRIMEKAILPESRMLGNKLGKIVA